MPEYLKKASCFSKYVSDKSILLENMRVHQNSTNESIFKYCVSFLKNIIDAVNTYSRGNPGIEGLNERVPGCHEERMWVLGM